MSQIELLSVPADSANPGTEKDVSNVSMWNSSDVSVDERQTSYALPEGRNKFSTWKFGRHSKAPGDIYEIKSDHSNHHGSDSHNTRPGRRPSDPWTIVQFLLDICLIVPALLFLVYAILIYSNKDENVEFEPIPTLRSAALYGPTIFPIVFAAVIASFLKAFAAHRLERGMSVLQLEYLLSSKIVFSTILTPLSLRKFHIVTPWLLVLWALSPLGGQASVRVIEVKPSNVDGMFQYFWLDPLSVSWIYDIGPSSWTEIMPTLSGLFTVALAASSEQKASSMDPFGSVKVPMLEGLNDSRMAIDEEGWYDTHDIVNMTYTALLGVPGTPLDQDFNYSYRLQRPYMYTNCTVSKQPLVLEDWLSYARNASLSLNASFNGGTLLIESPNSEQRERTTPLVLHLASWSEAGLMNSTCHVTTTYAEVDVHCQGMSCLAIRVRKSPEAHSPDYLTFLDGLDTKGGTNPGNKHKYFLDAFVNITQSPWVQFDPSRLLSTPLEYYFQDPAQPYTPTYLHLFTEDPWWKGADIGEIGDTIFSQRFSQLVNTMSMAYIAAFTTGLTEELPDNVTESTTSYQDYMGTKVRKEMVLHCNGIWFAILVIASLVMLVAAVTAAILRLRCRAPDVLDHSTSLLRNTPYADAAKAEHSMQNAFEQARKRRDVQVCIGDTQASEDVGHIALGTTDQVVPIGKVSRDRKFL